MVATPEWSLITLLQPHFSVAVYGRPRSRYGYATPQEVCSEGHEYMDHQAAMERIIKLRWNRSSSCDGTARPIRHFGSPTDRDHHESALRGTRYQATIFRHEIELNLAKTQRVKALVDFDHQMER